MRAMGVRKRELSKKEKLMMHESLQASIFGLVDFSKRVLERVCKGQESNGSGKKGILGETEIDDALISQGDYY